MRETWVLSLDWEDPSGGGQGTPLQYFCLENMDRGAWRATVHEVTHQTSDTTERLSTAQVQESLRNHSDPQGSNQYNACNIKDTK